MKRTFYFLGSLSFLLIGLARQRWYLRQHLPDLESRFEANTDGSLSKKLRKKMRYYAELMPVMVGDMFCILRGRPMSSREREMQTYLAIFTPIFDEWFDNQQFTPSKVKEFLFHPHNFTPQNDFEKLTLDVLKHLHALAPKSISWAEVADKLDKAQAQSNRHLSKIEGQSAAEIQNLKSKIRNTTYEKGGYAFYLTRLFLEYPLSKTEEKAVMQFGFLIQYIDDIFDIREDRLDGTRTLATETTEIADLDTDFRAELSHLFSFLEKTDFLPKNQKRFRRVIMVLFSMGFIALQQLSRAQKKYGGAFDPDKLTRQELVCDMAKWENWVWWARLYRF